MTNSSHPVRVGLVEQAKIFQICGREALPIALRQALREGIYDLLAVLRALGTALEFVHDLPPDEPVGCEHTGVDRPDDVSPRLFEDRDDAVE